MKLRSALRAAAVLAGVAGLTGVLVPPASAEGTKTVVFAGDATVTGGLGYPCTPAGADPAPNLTDNTAKKPPVGGSNKTCPPDIAPGNPTDKKQKPMQVNGNTRTGSFRSATCAATGATTAKSGKGPTSGGPCVITSTFVVTGYCGLSQGEGRATVTIDNQLGADQSYGAHYFWFSSGTLLTLRGQAWVGTGGTKPANPDWYLTGSVSAAPDPTVLGTSCTDKTGQSFNIEGTVEIVHPNPT